MEKPSLSEREFLGLLGEPARAQELGGQDQGRGAELLAEHCGTLYKRVQRGIGGGLELYGEVLPSVLSGNLGCLPS